MIRCFVAAELPAAVRTEMGALQRRLRGLSPAVRWVAPRSMHLTLKFLGEQEPESFDRLLAGLGAPIEGCGRLQLGLQGLGVFPQRGNPRVLWVGLAGDVGGLRRAALQVEARAEKLGVPRERRPFRPHLTLARVKGRIDVGEALASVGTYGGPTFSVDQLVLFESNLTPQGARYTPRLRIPLT